MVGNRVKMGISSGLSRGRGQAAGAPGVWSTGGTEHWGARTSWLRGLLGKRTLERCIREKDVGGGKARCVLEPPAQLGRVGETVGLRVPGSILSCGALGGERGRPARPRDGGWLPPASGSGFTAAAGYYLLLS